MSFGCASVVVEHVQTLTRDMRRSRMRPSVAVIGSGVIGLTVATELRRKVAALADYHLLEGAGCPKDHLLRGRWSVRAIGHL